MNQNIPEKMLAAGLNTEGNLILKTVPVPVPRNGEVLVKIAAAPVNPSDLARIKHLPVDERTEFIAGIEGSGRVVAHGKGLIPALWMGRRVACSSAYPQSGTWAQYMVTKAMSCIPLPSGIPDEQGSMLLVNPMTAVAFFEIAKRNKHQAVINSAAASALGGIIDFLAKKENIPLIQVVRTNEQVAFVKERGGNYVLNIHSPGFDKELSKYADELKATLALDCIGGEFTRMLLESVPYNSTVMVYGNLSGEDPVTNHRSLVTDNKKISGFYLVNWLKEQGMIATLKCLLKARKLIKNDIIVPVNEKRPLSEVQQAIDGYLSHMSAGKVLLIP
jgi:NADPH:quinone reductase-like Zn-dependent oxidoreductase